MNGSTWGTVFNTQETVDNSTSATSVKNVSVYRTRKQTMSWQNVPSFIEY